MSISSGSESVHETINSPIQVSPTHGAGPNGTKKNSDSKLSVKDRLYVDKRIIGEYLLLLAFRATQCNWLHTMLQR